MGRTIQADTQGGDTSCTVCLGIKMIDCKKCDGYRGTAVDAMEWGKLLAGNVVA